uniref:Uncharacterized protein n=1 Tax=Avena sativa TaxID=4498 RepID=A0ACD5W7L5_AVESA
MAMAVIHLARPALAPSPLSRPRRQRLRVMCRVGGDEGDGGRGSDEDAPESLFAKELRRRGMSAGSVPSGEKVGATAEAEEGGPGGEARRKRVVGAEFQRAAAAAGVDGQRERSMALNSEGLEGLVPRAKVLVSLGGTFFLAFGPLIIVTVSLFAGLYLYFGQSFIHDGSNKPVTPPPYIDPYELLEDDRISRPPVDLF